MPEPTTYNVLGSEVLKGSLLGMRDMIASPAWVDFCSVMDNSIQDTCAALLSKDAPTNEELQGLSGAWRGVDMTISRFPKDVEDAVKEMRELEDSQK